MIEELLSRYSNHVEFIGDELTNVRQAGIFGSQIIHLASFAGHCDDIENALSAGANIDAIGDLGLSALHYAVLGESLDAVRLLISKGANLTLENEFGETPAQMARIMGFNNIENILCNFGCIPIGSFDGGEVAKQRWLEFKSIQEGNFLNQ
ncbi:ankyrin repeat domain-containing protein [Aquabacterium sp. A7-Y]|uniref:ankyrin repeat domain-containing protein n=1 Tax=Aquabacterium sp. A7-Y TaxID=1349605 RepID=UPI00223CA86B|nr:ankyrin repeat domain-containing protein [Aquabacterium sp. A7-Y]MCW7542077.1 ankyrin repeat domain-containing protein [Aquabacterium sp. A7-Y]